MKTRQTGITVLLVALVVLLSVVAQNRAQPEGAEKSTKPADPDAVTRATAPPPDYPHDMETALEFLQKTRMGYLATVDEGMPRVRAWGLLQIEGDTLYFATANNKAVFDQLKTTPYAEYVTIDPQTFTTLRVFGEVVFVDDVEKKKAALAGNPMLQRIYSGEKEKEFEMFCLRDVELNWFAFSQVQEEVKEDIPE